MTSVNPIGASGLTSLNGDLTATQLVNASHADTNFQAIRAKVDALIVALKPTIRNDNQLADAIVRLRCLSSEIITIIADGGNTWQIKVAVQAASTGNLTLSGEQTFDAFTSNASRVLVKDQTDPTQNGIYTTGAGAWTRTADANTGALMARAAVAVTSGSANKGTAWVLTLGNTTPIIGTTALIFAQFGGGGVSGNDNNNYVDVTALPYSLVAGDVSDSVAIANLAGFRSALAAANGLGKSVYVPIGAYRLHISTGQTDGLTIPSNTKIFGLGMELSVLEFSSDGQLTNHVKLANTSNVVWEDIGIRNRSSAAQCLVYDWAGAGHNIIHNRVMFHGNGTGATRPENILRVENDGTYSRVRFHDCWWTDFRFGVSSNNAFSGVCSDWQWVNCTFTTSSADGIELNRLTGTGTGVWDKCLIDGCYFDTVTGTPGVSGLGIGFSGVTNSIISNCFARNVSVNAFIHVEDYSSNIVMMNNIAINVYKGIEVYPTCTNMRAIGNSLYGTGVMSGLLVGLYMVYDPRGAAIDVVFKNNHVQNFSLGIYTGDAGATYDVSGNQIIGCNYGIEFRKNCMTVQGNIISTCTYGVNCTADGSRFGKNTYIDCGAVRTAGSSPFTMNGITMHKSLVPLTSTVAGNWDLFTLPTYLCGVVDVQLWQITNPALVRSSHMTVTYKAGAWTIVLTAFDLNGVMLGVDSMVTNAGMASIPVTVTNAAGADCFGYYDFTGIIRFL